MSDYVHNTTMKPSPKIAPFNIFVWAGGFALGIYWVYRFGSFEAMFFTWAVAAVVGFPFPGSVTLPRLIQKRQHSRGRLNRNGGFWHRQAVLEDLAKAKADSPWEDHVVLEASYQATKKVKKLPLVWTASSDSLTVYFPLVGASVEWVDGDPAQKMDQEDLYMRLVERAIGRKSDLDFIYGVTRMQRPANIAAAFRDLRLRSNKDMLEAADSQGPSDFYDETDARIARNTNTRVDILYTGSKGGEPIMFGFVTFNWPKKAGKKVVLSDPHAFTKSNAFKLLSRVAGALEQSGMGAGMITRHQLVTLLETNTSVKLRARQTWNQRDQEMVDLKDAPDLDKTPGASPDSWRPASSRYQRSEDGGYLVVDGTAIATGSIKKVVRQELSAGFMEQALEFDQGIWWTYTLWVEVRRGATQKAIAQEKEAAINITNRVQGSIIGETVENVGAEERIEEHRKMRRELHRGGSKAAAWHILFSVLTDDVPEIDTTWNDATDDLANTYESRRAHEDLEVIDLVRAHVGWKPKNK